MDLVRQHKFADATTRAAGSGDPVARKVVEWALLRASDGDVPFERYAAFIGENPDWPGVALFRRQAEARLWYDRRDPATVRRFLGGEPASALGRLALARQLKSEGDRAGAAREVRAVWQTAELSPDLEIATLDAFRDELTPDDHAARMDWRIGARDFGGAARAARHLGDEATAIVKACAAANSGAAKARAQFAEVSGEARGDPGFVLCQVRFLQREDPAGAAQFLLSVTPESLARQDADAWWRERRLLSRRLIDIGDPKTAYRVVHEAAVPANAYYRAEFHFMAGWIALRWLGDPGTAFTHFASIDEGAEDPIVRARAAYWRGRAAEAAGDTVTMRQQYQAAARHPTAYYGQLARARLGFGEIAAPRTQPEPARAGNRELLRALDVLYATGERDLALTFVSDLAEKSRDAALLSALGEITARYGDARSMLVLGKTALARGLAMDRYAFPEIGVPSYRPITSELDRCVVYSIVRTESAFDQRDKSNANAVGLMQVTPEAGRDTAKRFGVAYNWKRLVSDPAYNIQMGSAELAALLKEYRGSYIMAFAGYNAGRGRVREWVAQHGDPRDPKVDAVDWVERIPLAETRNYVQRVMENLQIYRARFGATVETIEPNLHRTLRVESNAGPAQE